jgi:hypothetical protein
MGANFPRPHELLRLQDRAARAREVEVLVDRIFEHIIPIGLFRCGGGWGSSFRYQLHTRRPTRLPDGERVQTGSPFFGSY